MREGKKISAMFVAGLLLLIASTGIGHSSDLVVDTQFVAERLGKPDWVILDTRISEEYKELHIQGAINLGKRADKALRDPTHRSYTIVPSIEKTLGAAGIGSDKHIILYGKAVDVYYNTVPFWVLEYVGCNSSPMKCTVHYYDGGFERWEAEGGKVESTDSTLPPTQFRAHVVASRLATTEEVLEVAKGKKKALIIDARSEAEYNGSDIRALRGGHIPGAVNMKVQKNYTADNYRMLPLSELESLYKDISRTARVIAHCQTGTRSTYTYLVLRLLNYENVANYDDSWIVYGSNVNFPVENEQWYDFFEVTRSLKEMKEMQQK
jgi:thiosulfate/3-mercaptopyruvate sulfurtransferase